MIELVTAWRYNMPTTPPPRLRERDIVKADQSDLLEKAVPLLDEIVNHGLALFARCMHGGEEKDLAILAPYLHLVEMIDGVRQLVAQVAIVPARLQLRAAFEALLTIEYVTESDSERRAYAYLVANIRRRIQIYRSFSPNPVDSKLTRADYAADSHARHMPFPEIGDADQRIQNLERLLTKPKWREGNTEFRATAKRIRRRPPWFALYGGPENVADLARHVQRGYQYHLLYRQWSQTMHVDDIDRQLTRGPTGGGAFRGLCDPSELRQTVCFASVFAVGAARRVLSFYRPEEIEAGAYERWYTNEISEPFLMFCNAQPT
jgi:hypothetical protein